MLKETMYKANQLYNGFLKLEEIRTVLQANTNKIRIDLYERDNRKTAQIAEYHLSDDSNTNCDAMIRDIVVRHLKIALAEIESTLNNELDALKDKKEFDVRNILD